jgi:WD40 repeat protein
MYTAFKINSIAWSPDGKQIATAGTGKTIRIWNVAQDQLALTCRGHQDLIRLLAYSPDGSRLASISEDRTARIWNTGTGETLTCFQCTPRRKNIGGWPTVTALAWSPDGRRLATGAYEPAVRIWDAAKGEPLLTYHTGGLVVQSIAWSPDGSQMATGIYAQPIEIWNTTDGTRREGCNVGFSARSIMWSSDGTRIAALAPKVMLWEVATGAICYETSGYMPLSWSRDRRFLAYPVSEKIVIRNAEDGSTAQFLPGDTSNITALCWSPDGRHLASGSSDKTVRIWSLDQEA